MQKKCHSLLEAGLGTAIGYGIAFGTWVLIAPWFGYPRNLEHSFWITNIFTIVSLARSYFIRRLFNYLHVKELL